MRRFIQAAALALAASTAQADDGGPIRIGVLNDMSTIYSIAGGQGSVVAAQLAVQDAGPVLGRKIEIVSADHQNKADVGAVIAKRWYDQEGVDMITDVPNSAVGFVVQGLAQQYKKLVLVTGTLSADFTGPRCNAYSAAWVLDTYTQASVLGRAVVRAGGDSWFFLGADYTFGHMLVKDARAVVEGEGAKVLGQIFAPLGTPDFSSFLLQAQQSKAKIIGLANATSDTSNAIKQAREFGLDKAGQKFATFVVFIHDVKAIGLEAAQGLQLVTPFYWDLDEESRAFSKRFQAKIGHPPTWDQAGVYSAVNHYLKAIKAAGTKDSEPVMAKMRELPIEDFMSKGATLRADGRVVRDTHLFEVKAPSASNGPWDLYRRIATIRGEEIVRPPNGCPLPK